MSKDTSPQACIALAEELWRWARYSPIEIAEAMHTNDLAVDVLRAGLELYIEQVRSEMGEEREKEMQLTSTNQRLLLTMLIATQEPQNGESEFDQAGCDTAARVSLFSSFREHTPTVEILRNEPGLLQLLLPVEQEAFTSAQILSWLRLSHDDRIARYECDLIADEHLRELRAQVLKSRAGVIEPSDVSIEKVKAIASLQREENGVQFWTQDFHYNVHYLVADGQVFMRCGYWGQTLFNWLAHGRMVYDLQGEQWWF